MKEKISTWSSWLQRRFPVLLSYGIVVLTFAVGYLAVARTRPLFQPDARYYLAMSFWFSGDSQEAAHARLTDYLAPIGMEVPSEEQLFGWGLVQPRVVLPALAAPFVKLFGPDGMLIVTGAAALALTILLTWLLARRFGYLPAVATMVLVSASPLIVWFNVAMLTESLSALWGALAVLLAWWYRRRPGWKLVAGLVLVTLISAFTRQATFIVAGAFVLAWLLGSIVERRNSSWAVPALAVSATAIGAQLLQSLLFPSFSQLDQFLKQAGVETVGDAILAVPRMVFHLLRTDIRTFMEQDHALLILIVLASASALIFFQREESHLLLGAVLGIALYNITNGVPTSFRYAMPGLIFFLLSTAVILARTARPLNALHDSDEIPTAASPRS